MIVLLLQLEVVKTSGLNFNMDEFDSQHVAQETPTDDVFIAPSIHEGNILSGRSYTHHSAVPELVSNDVAVECVLGVDEAGRGPVLGMEIAANIFPRG